MRALEIASECGWRPNCQSCAEGGRSCTWCNRRNGYCDTLATAVLEYEYCEQVPLYDGPPLYIPSIML